MTQKRKRGIPGSMILLLIPYLGLLVPGMYARQKPELFGFPFFYWYQFAWIPGGALITAIVFWIERRRS